MLKLHKFVLIRPLGFCQNNFFDTTLINETTIQVGTLGMQPIIQTMESRVNSNLGSQFASFRYLL